MKLGKRSGGCGSRHLFLFARGSSTLLFAQVGDDHAGNDNGHCRNLRPAQTFESHQHGGYCGHDRQQVLVKGSQFRANVFYCGLHEKIGKEGRAKKNEGDFSPRRHERCMQYRHVPHVGQEKERRQRGKEENPAQKRKRPVCFARFFYNDQVKRIAKRGKNAQKIPQNIGRGLVRGTRAAKNDYDGASK